MARSEFRIRSARRGAAGRALVWAGLAIAALLPSAARAEDLLGWLPRETLAAVSVSDLRGLPGAWEASPFGRLAADPRFQRIFSRYREAPRARLREWEAQWRISPREVRETFQGGAALFFTLYEWITPEVYEYDICFLAEVSDPARARELVERALEKTPVDARRSRQTFRGRDIYDIRWVRRMPLPPPQIDPQTWRTVQATPAPGSAFALVEEIPITVQYALTDRFLIVCEGRREPLRLILAALEDPAARLGADPDFRRCEQALGPEGAARAWARTGRLWKTFADHKKAESPKGVDWLTLGFQETGGALARMRLEPDRLTLDLALALPETLPGPLGPLFKPGPALEMKSARLVPPDALSYSCSTYDGRRLWGALRDLLMRMAPQAIGLINLQFQQFQRDFGVNVERDLIETLGGEIALYERKVLRSLSGRAEFNPWEDGQIETTANLMLGLRDGRAFRQSAERTLAALRKEPYEVPFEVTPYLGHEIWTVDDKGGALPPVRPAWTLTDAWLFFSADSEELPGLLRAWTGKSEKSLAGAPGFAAAAAAVPREGLVSFSYSSPEAVANAFRPLWLMVTNTPWTPDWLNENNIQLPSVDLMTRYLGACVVSTHVTPRLATARLEFQGAK